MSISPRRILDLVDTTNSLLGLLLTTTLTWLVLMHSPREATAAYRRVLYVTCAIYYLNALVPAMKMQLQIMPTEGRIYVTTGGWWRWKEPWDRYALVWVMWSMGVYNLAVPLQSTYRYLAICKWAMSGSSVLIQLLGCRDKRFTACKLITFLSTALAISLIGPALVLLIGPDPPMSERVRALLFKEPIWVEDPPLRFIVLSKVISYPYYLMA